MRPILRHTTLVVLAALALGRPGSAQMTAETKAKRWDIEKELQSLAVVDRKVMMRMRDGVRLATDIYRPKDSSNWDILGPPTTDGYDAIQWMSSQPWSNGRVGLIGCSSTAGVADGGGGTIAPGPRGDDPDGLRCRGRPGGALL